ncbi:hypothetical protein PINS_up001478 [Pythium insidiosum]|nr:hypothetical protein PINS_up001478 [Pythium insidiosum]
MMLNTPSSLSLRLRIAAHARCLSSRRDIESAFVRDVDARLQKFHAATRDAGVAIEPRNFSFSGCGFLIPYHLGVAHALQDMGYLHPSRSRVAGASGGAIAALAIAANADLPLVVEDTKAVAAFGRSKGSWGKLELRLRELFDARFRDVDMDALANRLTVATQKVWPTRELVLTDAFESPQDLCDAVIASSFIPFYLSRQAMTTFRGEFHIDGGFVKLVPEVPEHVRVCAFHADMLRRPDYEISPSMDATFPFSIWELARFALFPPEADVLDHLFQRGRKAAVLWAESELAGRLAERDVARGC